MCFVDAKFIQSKFYTKYSSPDLSYTNIFIHNRHRHSAGMFISTERIFKQQKCYICQFDKWVQVWCVVTGPAAVSQVHLSCQSTATCCSGVGSDAAELAFR